MPKKPVDQSIQRKRLRLSLARAAQSHLSKARDLMVAAGCRKTSVDRIRLALKAIERTIRSLELSISKREASE